MSLSPQERRELNRISTGLTVSDPILAALMGTFARLTTSEAMPAHEQVEAGWRHLLGTVQPTRQADSPIARRGLGQLFRRAGVTMLVLVPLIALLVGLAVFLSTSSLAPCRASLSMGCTKPAPRVVVHAGQS